MAQTPKLFLIVCITTASLLATPYATADDSRELEVDEQPLSDALKTIANEFGVDIAFFPEATDGLDGIALVGSYTSGEAFDALLEDTELEYQALDNGTVVVRAKNQGGDSDSKNSQPTPALMAQNTTSQTQATTVSRSDEDGTSVVTGRVTDARTGANLKGAKVTIEETGQWTATDNLGEFRLVNVPTGSATLTVSFLGYAGQSTVVGVRRDSVRQDFSLRGGTEIEEIVVFGQRSARAIALNQERTAENTSTVLSADMLGNFSGTTISDALRRTPGVAFVPDETTGDGANIILRGLEPDLNQVQLNGVRLPEVSGIGRAPALNSILTEAIDKVTVNKTLLPNHDTNGSGGLVEIETKSPLDRTDRFANLGLEHTGRGDGYGQDLLASGTLSRVFGHDADFGASVSVQYREQDVTRVGYDSEYFYGQYLPAGVSDIGQIDPTTRFPFEPGVDEAYPQFFGSTVSNSVTENLSFTGTVEKQFGDHTNIRLDYTRTDVKQTDFSTSSGASVSFAGYDELPIDELGGELRYALISERGPDFFLPGLFVNVTRRGTYTPTSDNETDVLSLRGNTEAGRWSFNYGLGYSSGKTDIKNLTFSTGINRETILAQLSAEDFVPSVGGNTVDGLIVSIFDPIRPGENPGFVFPGFTDARLAVINDPSISVFTERLISINQSKGDNERVSATGSARYDFDWPSLKYVDVGFMYEDAEFVRLPPPFTTEYIVDRQTSIADLGLEHVPGILEQAGLDRGGFDSLSSSSVTNFYNSLDSLVRDGLLDRQETDIDDLLRRAKTTEREFAPYLQLRFDIGALGFVGGVRVSRVDLQSDFRSRPSLIRADGTRPPGFTDENAQLVTAKATFTDVLPRFTATYRFSENVLTRFAYFVSVARPQIRQINQSQTATLDLRPQYGPNSDQPRLIVSQGNPDLKPALTHSLDLSVEWYTEDLGAIKLGAFYKEIENALSANNFEGDLELSPLALDLPDIDAFRDLPDNLFVDVLQPINSDDDSKIWGIEASIEKRFTSLPDLWSGLGIYANYTYTDSSRTRRILSQFAPNGEFVITDLPFRGSPEDSGTAALTYNYADIDATLAYTFQDRRLSVDRNFGLDRYFDEVDSLDFSAAYYREIGGQMVRFHFQGNDLLKGKSDPTLSQSEGGENGAPLYNGVSHSYFGGRSFVLGVNVTFD